MSAFDISAFSMHGSQVMLFLESAAFKKSTKQRTFKGVYLFRG
ncbi:hypothetical protein VCR14J2_380131 [Vibrio coralliirubri]|nr:hypothetical protein VCR14J2_380131 [Vibrio coralliirubri]